MLHRLARSDAQAATDELVSALKARDWSVRRLHETAFQGLAHFRWERDATLLPRRRHRGSLFVPALFWVDVRLRRWDDRVVAEVRRIPAASLYVVVAVAAGVAVWAFSRAVEQPGDAGLVGLGLLGGLLFVPIVGSYLGVATDIRAELRKLEAPPNDDVDSDIASIFD